MSGWSNWIGSFAFGDGPNSCLGLQQGLQPVNNEWDDKITSNSCKKRGSQHTGKNTFCIYVLYSYKIVACPRHVCVESWREEEEGKQSRCMRGLRKESAKKVGQVTKSGD